MCSYGEKSMRSSVCPDICGQRDISAALHKCFDVVCLGSEHLRQDGVSDCLTTRRSVLWVQIRQKKSRDVNKDLTPKDQDKDKDLTPKDQDKDKDLTLKDQDQDKDFKNVLKESLRTRTRTRINITDKN